MRRLLFCWVSGLFLAGCATTSLQTQALLRSENTQQRVLLNDVPFIPQEKGDCGPAALSMALEHQGVSTDLERLRGELLTPKQSGTLPTDMIRATREYQVLALPVSTVESLALQIQQGRPVVLLQNLGLSWAPHWHYAVAVGFDKEEQVFYIHSGSDQARSMPMTHFERHWELGEYWAIFLLKPGESPPDGIEELDYMKAASGLEAAEKMDAAEKAYEQALRSWPQSLSALIGMGNIMYQKRRYKESVAYLQKAVEFHPDSEAARNNLRVAKAHL